MGFGWAAQPPRARPVHAHSPIQAAPSDATQPTLALFSCYPHLLYHFVYHVPTLADLWKAGPAGLLCGARFLFSRDLTIAETFCRRFLWHELMLWPDDMPAATVVALSHDDDLVPRRVAAWGGGSDLVQVS